MRGVRRVGGVCRVSVKGVMGMSRLGRDGRVGRIKRVRGEKSKMVWRG